MRLLLYGEGPGDVGEPVWNSGRRRQEVVEGWMQPLVRKVVGPHTEFKAFQRRDLILLPRDSKRHRPLPKGHGARALAAKYRALEEACDGLVFMTDADTPNVTEWRGKVAEVVSGFDALNDPLPGVACVPMAMSECWLLADSDAWQACAGGVPEGFPKRHLERLWGPRDDPDGNHPHQIFRRLCKRVGLSDGRQTRHELADATSMEALATKCRISWVGFFEAAQEAFAV